MADEQTQTQAEPVAQAEPVQAAPAKGPVVLIVEDEDLVARMYQTNLEHAGFKVELARDGEEGLEMAKKLNPGVIVTDIMMPRMNGIQMLEELKADAAFKDTPIVILSNLSGEYDKELALGKGAAGYWVKKELSPKQLEAELKKILGM